MKNSCLSVKRKDAMITTLLLLTLTLGTIANLIPYGRAQGTEVVLTNPSTGNGNFIYSPANGTIGTRFNATVWVSNVSDLFGYQVRLDFTNESHDNILNITGAWTPTWNSSWVFYGQMYMPLGPTFYDTDSDGYYEGVLVGATELGSATTFTGDGLLAIIEFNITATPENYETLNCTLNIDNDNTKLTDSTVDVISCAKIDGYYEYVTPPVPQLIVEPSHYTATHLGEVFNVSVNLYNIEATHRMIGVQFRLQYNNTFLDVLNVTEGPFLPQFNQTPTPPYTYFQYFVEDDIVYGPNVVLFDLLMPNGTGDYPGPFPEGNGTIATITFNVTGTFPGAFPLKLNSTMIIDDELNQIQHIWIDGYFELFALTVTITQQPQAAYGVLSTASMDFTVQYPNGTFYTADNLGSITVGIYNGTHYIKNITLSSENFDSFTNEWTVKWIIQEDTPPLDTYSFIIRAHEIVDKAGNSGPLVDASSNAFTVLEVSPITVDVDVGEIHFRGETAEFYILISTKGKPFPFDANVTATLYKPDSTTEEITVVFIDTGLYKAEYNISISDPVGTYNLVVEASSFAVSNKEFSGIAQESFLVSPTLTGWDALLVDIKDEIATIVIPNLTEIKANLTAINATITDLILENGELLLEINTTLGSVLAELDLLNATLIDIDGTVATIYTIIGDVQTSVDNINAIVIDINGTVATIGTSLGSIQTSVDNINATISELIVDSKGEILAKIDTALGDVTASLDDLDAKITDIDGSIATISTTVGEIKASLSDIVSAADDAKSAAEGAQSAATTTLYATSTLSAIAAIIGILILLLLKKK